MTEKNSTSELVALADDALTNAPKELSERQVRIVNYKLRGMTQASMAQLEDVSQPMISKEITAIKAVYKAQGMTIDQDMVVGESINLFGEVERRGWEVFHLSKKNDKPGAANSALMTVMAAREKSIKLLMELGILKKAATEHEHTLKVAPFLEKFRDMQDVDKQAELKNFIDVSLTELEEPEPPLLMADLEEPEAPEDV
jgi:hypothetical protein